MPLDNHSCFAITKILYIDRPGIFPRSIVLCFLLLYFFVPPEHTILSINKIVCYSSSDIKALGTKPFIRHTKTFYMGSCMVSTETPENVHAQIS